MKRVQSDEDAAGRRSFLGEVAVGGTLGLAAMSAPGCVGLPEARDVVGALPGEVDEFCRRFDLGSSKLDGSSLVGDVVRRTGTRSAAAVRFAANADPVARRALRSLHVAGIYGDLSPAARRDPRVVQRISDYEPELDASVMELRAMMASMPASERARIGAALRSRSHVMRVAEALDTESRHLGVSPATRAKLRAVAKHVDFRLSKQPPSAFLDEYVAKVDKVAATRGIDLANGATLAAEGMERLFWQEQRRAAATRHEPNATAQSRSVATAPERTNAGHTRGRALFITGGAVLGVGAVLFGIGIVVSSGGFVPGYFLLTAGAIGAVGGIVLLIIGAIVRSRSS